MKKNDIYFMVQFEQLAEAMSPTAALRLCAFFGPGILYVPAQIPESHPIYFVIGKDASEALACEFGSQKLEIPSSELTNVRRAGRIFSLLRHGLSATQIARALNMTQTRVCQVVREMEGIRFDR